MNYKRVAVVALFLAMCLPAWAAEDGAALYQKKCAGCHGANGEGKPAVKAPALKGTKLDAGQLVKQITTGDAASKAPHNKGIAGITPDQAQAIADYIKTLK